MIGTSLHSLPNPAIIRKRSQDNSSLIIGSYPNERPSSTVSLKREWVPLKTPYALNNLPSQSISRTVSTDLLNSSPYKVPLSLIAQSMNLDNTRDALAKELGSRGIHGLFSFIRSIKRGNYYGDISQPKFEMIFEEHRLGISKPDLHLLFKELDERRRCLITANKFLDLLKMNLSSTTIELLHQIYRSFPRSSSGVLASTIRQRYQPQFHPSVLSGQKSPTTVLVEFLDSFDWEHELSFLDFQSYYEFIRLTFDTEEEFNQILQKCWDTASISTSSVEPKQASITSSSYRVSSPSLSISTCTHPTPPSPSSPLAFLSSTLPPSATYDPSHQFSLSSPVSIGIHSSSPSVPALTPTPPSPLSPSTPPPSSSLMHSSKPAKLLLQSYFSSKRPLPFVRQLLLRHGTTDLTWDQLLTSLHSLCPLEYLHLLWKELNPSATVPTVSVEALMEKLRLRNLNASRLRIVEQAYQKLDTEKTGNVPMERLKKNYRPLASLPQKSTSTDYSVRDISLYFKGPTVTKQEFTTYYADVGSSIEDDNYFVLMVWNEWGLSCGSSS